MRIKTLLKIIATTDVITYDEAGVSCKLTKEDKAAICSGLNMQVPKAPRVELEEYTSNGDGFVIWVCPGCKSLHNTDHGKKYCDECGQMLDWQ